MQPQHWGYLSEMVRTNSLIKLLRSRRHVQQADLEDLQAELLEHLLRTEISVRKGQTPEQAFGAALGKTLSQVWSNYYRRQKRTRARFQESEDPDLFYATRSPLRILLAREASSNLRAKTAQYFRSVPRERWRILRNFFRKEGVLEGQHLPIESHQQDLGIPRATAQGWRRHAQRFLEQLRSSHLEAGWLHNAQCDIDSLDAEVGCLAPPTSIVGPGKQHRFPLRSFCVARPGMDPGCYTEHSASGTHHFLTIVLAMCMHGGCAWMSHTESEKLPRPVWADRPRGSELLATIRGVRAVGFFKVWVENLVSTYPITLPGPVLYRIGTRPFGLAAPRCHWRRTSARTALGHSAPTSWTGGGHERRLWGSCCA